MLRQSGNGVFSIDGVARHLETAICLTRQLAAGRRRKTPARPVMKSSKCGNFCIRISSRGLFQ
ncbi:hypothetical protein KCP76_16890 [Salmonella enterica subsp. enterica serovar Weltevreden]|nr:hypothetical protein KCP76_16890 [Salmonella enterica subsp. enterica serovar Weltevreden]